MNDLETAHLNDGGTDSIVLTRNHQPCQPRVRRTAAGLDATLPARPDYELAVLTVAEAVQA